MSVLHGICHLFAEACYNKSTPIFGCYSKVSPVLIPLCTSKSPVFMELLETYFRGLTSNNPFEVSQLTLVRSQTQSVCLPLMRSKTNQNVFGALILLQSRKNLTANIPGAVFMARAGTPSCVLTSNVSDIIKPTAVEVGSVQFALVTLWKCTHVYCSGTDALTIPFHGHWISDAFKTYARLRS
ncbi:hypothetical protein PHPALM_28463 [Phytophthora palmivora]|uniref:Uncharacterized protein n=1 Tax=Phytophthora palmivora TaxID=4796 RepID=A0A2P4XA35_9STRA|nr:hypothetical protein PHPALM_28463 [Phytophthora palmivora]